MGSGVLTAVKMMKFFWFVTLKMEIELTALMMEAESSFETSPNVYQTTRLNILHYSYLKR
jgi:hypothetical protein